MMTVKSMTLPKYSSIEFNLSLMKPIVQRVDTHMSYLKQISHIFSCVVVVVVVFRRML